MEKFTMFQLVSKLKMPPDEIAKLLSETIFKNYETDYNKGMLSVDFKKKKL